MLSLIKCSVNIFGLFSASSFASFPEKVITVLLWNVREILHTKSNTMLGKHFLVGLFSSLLIIVYEVLHTA